MRPTKPTPRTVYVALGATGGIGREIVRGLAARGAGLAVAARSSTAVEGLASEVDGVPIVLDATRVDDVAASLDQTLSRFGRLDGVVNCVGSTRLKPAHRITTREWIETLELNLGTAFATVRAAGKTLTAEGGSVVLFSSAAARVGLPNHEAISAAKAGVEGLALAAAATYAPRRIRVNCVAPGLVETPLSEKITGNPAMGKASEKMHALGRIGQPGDVARAVIWLLDPEQDWVTGQVIGIDGGLARVRGR